MHIKAKLNNSITDRDIIVDRVNSYVGPNFDQDGTNMLIARCLVHFEKTGYYPDYEDMEKMLYALEMEAFEKRL